MQLWQRSRALRVSKLDDLIQEYCPDGVETKSLGVVCDIKTGKGITSKDTVIDGAYPVVSGGVGIMGYYDKFNREANTVTIARAGSAGFVNFITRKFWVNDKCFSVVPKDNYVGKINSRFLYFSLKSIENHIMSLKSTGSVPTVNTDKLSKIRIATPPLEVQKEIVNILDKFTQLEAELSAELEARRKQYDFYRNQLLTFEQQDSQRERDVKWLKLGDIAMFRNGKGHEKDVLEDGKFIIVNSKFISTNGVVKKFTDKQMLPLNKDDIVMVMSDLPNGKALAKTFYIDRDDGYSLNQRICSLTFNKNKCFPRFYYYMLNRHRKLLEYDSMVDQTNLKRSDIEDLIIPVPSLSEQHRIVSILDKFDKLVNDISEGLPAEINARRQQYEYYRSKLLTFRELSV